MTTSNPIQADLSLWRTLRTRRKKQEMHRGIDAMANRWISRAKTARLNERWLRREAEAIAAMQPQWQDLTDAQLDERTHELREIFGLRRHNNEHVRAAFAAMREVAWRTRQQRPFVVQVMGALAMFHNQIVEMATGEGKTLTASVAASVLGWLRRPVHVITVNDYLAERDADELRPVYQRAGLEVGAVLGETSHEDRLVVYRRNVVYTTQKELVADWLKDQLRLGRIADPTSTRWLLDEANGPMGKLNPQRHPANMILVPGLSVAIVDELDSVLIDEAVTPLIIAQPRGEDPQGTLYIRARDLARSLEQDRDYTMDPVKRQANLTGQGRRKLEDALRDEDRGIWRAQRRREEMVRQALVAQHCYLDGQHYQIVEGQVWIVDEYTGRFMPDRQWQHGLHQAVEAKHDLEVTADRDTLASMSFQQYFRQYPHLCGMTGTAADARGELEATYGLPVRIIPTNRPCIRQIYPQQVWITEDLKWKAIVDQIQGMHEQGRPVLVGTRSVEASELLSELLNERDLNEHQVLNAVHHKEEAEIVAQAGAKAAITVATNMAGRGTDIKLDDEVRKVGGLHVILTERHTSRRVDRQLMGRSGRQGDPGSAAVIVSLEDELVVKYAPYSSGSLRRMFAGRKAPLPQWAGYVFDKAQRRAQTLAFKARAATLRREQDLDKSLPI